MSDKQNSQAVKATAPGLFSSTRQDLLASVVVFLVALPLCMGIAIASGVPVAAGLITGIVGGLVVGWIAGAPLQVSGPAAGLTVIIFELVRQHGLEVLGVAVLLGGALQFAAGIFRFGRWFRAVSPAVIQGMLAGIGVLILASQFHVMVDDSPRGNGIENLLSIPQAIVKGLPLPEMGSVERRSSQRDLLQQFGALHEQQVQIRELVAERVPALVLEAGQESQPQEISQLEPLAARQEELTNRLAVLVKQLDSEVGHDPDQLRGAVQQAVQQSTQALEDLKQGQASRVRSSQANAQHSLEQVFDALKHHEWAAKVGLLTILSLVLWKLFSPKKLKLVPAPLIAIVLATVVAAFLKLPVLYVEVPDNLWSEIHFPSLTVLRTVSLGVLLQAGLVLAIVGSAETLLCATAVDQLQTLSRTNYNRELAAQGVGNMVCGFLGALPMTGVIVRSAANVEAGARTRLSAILHGLWLLVFVSLLAFVLRMIPTAALAAMLVYIGFKLVNIQSIKNLRTYGWGEIVIYVATVGTIVTTDLLTGVFTGIILSAAKLLYTFSHLDVRLNVDQAEQKAVMNIAGAATFIGLPRLATALEQVPGNVELHVDFEHLDYIDHACLDLLMNWAKQHEASGGSLVIDWNSLHANFHQDARNQSLNNRKYIAENREPNIESSKLKASSSMK